MKYTKGPWRIHVEKQDDISGIYNHWLIESEIEPSSGFVAAIMARGLDRHNSQEMANAVLIPAAPELYEALKMLCNHLDARDSAHYHGSAEIVKHARAAIVKAQGGENV